MRREPPHTRRSGRPVARAVAVAVLAVIAVRMLLAHEDNQTARQLADDDGNRTHPIERTLTPAERAATDDCVPMAGFKHRHDGYPPPYVVVKPAAGGPARVVAWERYEQIPAGRVWLRRACPIHPREGNTP